jgi:hypothetical protein
LELTFGSLVGRSAIELFATLTLLFGKSGGLCFVPVGAVIFFVIIILRR